MTPDYIRQYVNAFKSLHQKINLIHLALMIFGTLLMIWPALYNGYPLVYADSGTYINSCIHLETPIDRPLFYGIFLRITSMQAILWIPIVLQGFLTTWLLQRLIRILLPESNWKTVITIVVLLAFLTGLPWYTAQLMPDLFTALLPILCYLFLYDEKAGWKRKTGYIILLYIVTGMHFSNLFILFLIIGIYSLAHIKQIIARKSQLRSKVLLISAVLPVVILTHSCFTYARYGVFRTSAGSNLFFVAKCLESPLLKTYMRENKDRMDIPFEDKIDSIPDSPMGFLWDATSPLNQLGVNQIAINQQYDAVIRDMMTTSRYFKMFIVQCYDGTVQQIQFHKVGSGLVVYDENSSPGMYIHKYYESEYPQFRHAVQFRKGLEDNYHQFISQWVFYASIFVIFAGLCWRSLRKKWGIYILMTVGCVLINAFVTASLANVYDRLQVRVVWLLTLAAILLLLHLWKRIFTPAASNPSQSSQDHH